LTSWETKAAEMVEKQIQARGILSERVLDAMRAVPRHLFIPEELRESAWADCPLPIGEDQTISQPYMVARMTELLSPEEGDSVLEIGTGSGYQSAVLAAMGAVVTSIERIGSLAARARDTLASLGFAVNVIWADGRERIGCAEVFDGVVVTAATPAVEEWWTESLAPAGRLVAPVAVMSGGERLLLRLKNADASLTDTWLDYCRFVPLLGGTQTGSVDGACQ